MCTTYTNPYSAIKITAFRLGQAIPLPISPIFSYIRLATRLLRFFCEIIYFYEYMVA